MLARIAALKAGDVIDAYGFKLTVDRTGPLNMSKRGRSSMTVWFTDGSRITRSPLELVALWEDLTTT